MNSSNGGSSGARTAEVLNLLQEGYSLSDIQLRAGDTLAFVLVSDSDRDALPDRLETEFGTDPQRIDTDGDTLSDASEIYGNDLSGPPCNLDSNSNFVSNPRLADSDADGIDDATELANCENPSFRVTANAGRDQVVNTGMSVTLQGQAEGIFSGQPQYSWRLMSGPPVLVNGSPVTALQGIAPQFTAPDDVSTLIFTLDVEVAGGNSSDQVTVQVLKDRSAAVYVSSANSGNEDGSINAPFATLQRAISSLSPGDDLYVMSAINNGEVRPYELTSSLEIPDGTNMYGGYNSNWVRDVETQLTPVTMQATVSNQGVFSYQSISEPMELSGFALTSLTGSTSASDSLVALSVTANGAGSLTVENNLLMAGDVNSTPVTTPGSSYGARITDLARLVFQNNRVIAGAGGRGSEGARGDNGIRGNNGRDASGRTRGGGGSGNSGFDGGAGGNGGGCPAGRGGNGANGAGGNRAGSGGAAVPNIFATAPASAGGSGGPGSDGVAGPAAGLFGSSSGDFIPANGNAGTSGSVGLGGGGGGGGHARDIGACGGGGGGGGEGGTGGTAGLGGAGGGASVGVWLYEVADSQFVGNTITANGAGMAGDGGLGGTGGSGGSGGNSAAGSSNFLGVRGTGGGRGGSGGRGGRGGDGSGGAGGPSIGIFVGPNLTPFIQDNGIKTGQGGNGGSRGNSGTGGDSIGIYDANTNDGAVVVNLDNRFTIGMPGTAGAPSSGGSRAVDGCSGETNCR